MRQILVLVLMAASTTPVFADRATQNAARQRAVAAERESNIRMAAARKEAAVRQAAQAVEAKKAAAARREQLLRQESARREAVKKELAQQSKAKPGTQQTASNKQSPQQIRAQESARNAAGALLLGAFLLGMSDSDSGGSSTNDDAWRDSIRANRRDYYENRARIEASNGDYDAAARSLRDAQ